MFVWERQNLIDTIESEFNDKREYAINKCLSLMFDGSPLAVKNTGPGKSAADYGEERNRCVP